MPGGQRLQAVHSLLLGCCGAVQAAGLGLHSGGSPGEQISMIHMLTAAVQRALQLRSMCTGPF